MTDKDIAYLRLHCATPFVAVASKHALNKDEVFVLGEKMYEFVTKDTNVKQGMDTVKAPIPVKRSPSTQTNK